MPLAATVLIVLVGLLVIAGLCTFIVRSLRAGTPQPVAAHPSAPIGSPARVWLERAERAVREMQPLVAVPGFAAVLGDAAEVVEQLRADAGTVTRLNESMTGVEPDRLRDQHAELVRKAAVDAALAPARDAQRTRLDEVSGRLAERDALLARMQSTVLSLESTKDEVTGLAASPLPAVSGVDEYAPVTALRRRVHSLRGAYAELAEPQTGITDPAIVTDRGKESPSGQG